jgi:hypothetical protein
MQTATIAPAAIYKLPPLILHPFSDAAGPNKLVESSRASMMIQGLLPNSEFSNDQLDKKLLDGRFCEIRMLFYVGKDLLRWIEQCMDVVDREEDLIKASVKPESFAAFLVEDPPLAVREKLKKWGVADYKAIFTRALGLNAVFADVPTREQLSDDFIRNYYRFADHMFACRQMLHVFSEIRSVNFTFDLYASGEYSRMLEQQWEEPLTD